jgi:hypothetical protein
VPRSPSWAYESSRVCAAGARKTGIFRRVSWSDTLLVSFEITTRSGFLAAIASAFGVKPDRSVFGASAG